MVMDKITSIFIAGLVLIIVGALAFVITYTLLPIQLQAQADLLNASVSGVTLTTSQTNLINNTSNLAVLIQLLIPVIIVLAGIILIFVSAFEKAKGG